jgi:hypothetical protein
MKRFILIMFVASIALGSCTSSKKYLERQQYDMAIMKSVKKLMRNPTKIKEIDILRRAFQMANQQDKERIAYLKTTGQPDIWDEIFQTYMRMKGRQDRVKALPQSVLSSIGYVFVDYTQETVNAQQNAAEYYYQKGLSLLKNGDRQSARQAYDMFMNSKRFFTNYKDVPRQLQIAQQMGTANILFEVKNNSGKILPEGFVDEVLKIYLTDIEQLFVRYYTSYDTNITYHYYAKLSIRQVDVSPESVKEIYYSESKEVQDGYDYVLDSNGNVMKDSLGNDIKVPHMETITCNVREIQMHKQAIVSGTLDIFDWSSMLLKSDPITAETFFDYIYAFADGDESVLKPETRKKLNNPPQGFPNDLMMVFDAATIVKNISKDVITRNSYLFQ